MYCFDINFLHSKKELYTELKNAEELDIFGVSPYGDDSLIDVINRMKTVTVYIYNMKNNKQEVEVWNIILQCPHIFKDSSEAKNIIS